MLFICPDSKGTSEEMYYLREKEGVQKTAVFHQKQTDIIPYLRGYNESGAGGVYVIEMPVTCEVTGI